MRKQVEMDSVENSSNLKIPKVRRETQKLPKRVSEMSKEALEAMLRKKRECNAKALEIVERLLGNTVSEEWFLDCLKFISECHFQDIIEERSISMICGYPLCRKTLKNIPSQQYHISTKKNKVYDITERKKFCSNHCYKASSYVKAQLLTSPLWIRDKEEIPKFTILPVESPSGGIGEEIDIGHISSLKEELKQLHKQEISNKFTSVSHFTRDSLSQLVSDTESDDKQRQPSTESYMKDQNKTEVKDGFNEVKSDFKETKSTDQLEFQNETIQNVHIDNAVQSKETSEAVDTQDVNDSQDNRTVSPDKIHDNSCKVSSNFTDFARDSSAIHKVEERGSDILSNSPKSVCSKIQELKPKKNIQSKKKLLHIPAPIKNAVIHIEKCLCEWFTIESMCFLFGEEKIKVMVEEKGESIKEYYKVVGNASWDPKIQEQYMAICRRLNIMEIEDREYDKQTATKPLPDYTAVREEAKKMDLKIRAYYQGKTVYENEGGIRISEKRSDSAPVLPLVHLHAQNALRRRIVLDRLNRTLPDLLRTFDLSSRDVSGDVRSLVTTFRLGADNITFKPPEWSLLGLIILKMLSIKDKRLQILLDSEKVMKYTTMMLMSFQQDGGYLNRLMAWLTDIDNLLCKQ